MLIIIFYYNNLLYYIRTCCSAAHHRDLYILYLQFAVEQTYIYGNIHNCTQCCSLHKFLIIMNHILFIIYIRTVWSAAHHRDRCILYLQFAVEQTYKKHYNILNCTHCCSLHKFLIIMNHILFIISEQCGVLHITGTFIIILYLTFAVEQT